MKKRILSIVLVVCMVITLFPAVTVGISAEPVTGAHDHEWTYSLSKTVTDNDTLTASCITGCDYIGTDKTLTISFDKSSFEAKLSAETFCGNAAPAINYIGTGSTVYEKSTDAPTLAGTYRAFVTVGEGEKQKTAYVDFELKGIFYRYPVYKTTGDPASGIKE